MAKWNIKQREGFGGTFQYDSGKMDGEYMWTLSQDEKPFLEQAKLDREEVSKKDIGYKKFATIPDIVAVEVMLKHGIDIHDPDTMRDKTLMNRFRYIIKTEYPYLLSY